MEPLHPTDPPHVGKYRLTARLGAGGMGQVYLARTPSGRQLVIKAIRPDLASEDGFRARFAREAEAARKVGGFHTAQVVDADPDADPPWIATAHIPGPTLAHAVREHGPLTPPALHNLAAGLAEGLDAIHRCGLVHRDLKPGNIILAEDGPRIIDFGIARPLDADSMTTHGAVFGTLPYMSPEQTDNSRVGPASDVFSLGTVLAFAATGTSPFSGATMAETLRRLLSPPPDLGDLDPTIWALVHSCWNHDPDQRPTPHQVLGRFAAHDLHASWPPFNTDRPNGAAESPPAELDTLLRKPRSPSQGSRHAEAQPISTAQNETGQASSPVLQTADPSRSTVEKATARTERPKRRRGWYIGAGTAAAAVIIVLSLLLWHLSTSSRLTIPHNDVLNAVVFSPDGTTLATASNDHTAQLWDTNTGEPSADPLAHYGPVNAVAFSPDGTTLATASATAAATTTSNSDGDMAQLWDLRTGERTHIFYRGHAAKVHAVAFSPDGTTLAIAKNDSADSDDSNSDSGALELWDINARELITLPHDGWVRSVAFSPGGATLATASNDHTAQLWDTNTGEPTITLPHDGWVRSVAFSPDGTTLATASNDHTAQLWDTNTGEPTTDPLTHNGPVNAVAFSPDGTTLATASNDSNSDGGAVELWDANTGESVNTFFHNGPVNAVAFSPDGTTLATASNDGDAQLWDIG